jgi:hypothetical protein
MTGQQNKRDLKTDVGEVIRLQELWLELERAARLEQERAAFKRGEVAAIRPAFMGPASSPVWPSLETAWSEAEDAWGFPDDGIVDWALTLWHDSAGWHAQAWRSDTVDTQTDAVGSAVEALQAITRLA